MKVWNIVGSGEPKDVLTLADAPEPWPDGLNVLIDVEAIGLNYLDAMMCRGSYPAQRPPPLIPGAEIAGRVVDPGGSRFAIGDRVAGINPLGCGGLAERILLPSYSVFPLSDDVPSSDGAALMVTYQTAHFALHRRAALAKGDFLLVHAGAGGVGTAAIQLGKAAGAKVIATARGKQKLKVCCEEGADLTVDYADGDFVAAVLDYTGGAGADVICDTVGGAVFEKSLQCLAFEGRIVPIGWASGLPPTVGVSHIVMKNQTVLGLSWGSAYPRRRPNLVAAVHDELLQLYRKGEVRPRLSAQVKFSDAAMAIQRLASGLVIGKVVVVRS